MNLIFHCFYQALVELNYGIEHLLRAYIFTLYIILQGIMSLCRKLASERTKCCFCLDICNICSSSIDCNIVSCVSNLASLHSICHSSAATDSTNDARFTGFSLLSTSRSFINWFWAWKLNSARTLSNEFLQIAVQTCRFCRTFSTSFFQSPKCRPLAIIRLHQLRSDRSNRTSNSITPSSFSLFALRLQI